MSTATLPVAVVGGGPYGLSVSAHLAGRGVQHRIVGRPMSAWAQHMPRGMYLKSEGFASNLSAPGGRWTLREYCETHGSEYSDLGWPVPLETFVGYGRWFQQEAVPHLEQADVVGLDRDGSSFRLDLSDGTEVRARRVVLAVGNLPFAHVPPLLSALPDDLVTHTSACPDPSVYAGRDVTVVGSGASALDTAALLHEAGAEVRVVARRPAIQWNTNPVDRALVARLREPASGLGTGWRLMVYSRAPDAIRALPARKRLRIVSLTLGPAGGWWLRDRVQGRLPVLTASRITSAEPVGPALKLTLEGDTGEVATLETEHLIAATGYRVDLRRLPYLAPSVQERVLTLNGSPMLDRYFGSSVPGLHFVGLPAAATFGPVQRFVYGARFTAGRVAAGLSRER